MRIALFPSKKKQPAIDIAKLISSYLKNRQVEVFAEEEMFAELEVKPFDGATLQKLNFMISVGGDGTILRLLHKYPSLCAPILGVNMGSLGFMADVPRDDILPSIDDLLKGSFRIDKRLMLDVRIGANDYFAANDVVLHRGENHSLIEMAVYVDNFYMNTFEADGLIVATANGSTAYSLAAGGPIMHPDLEAFAITPICPHTISNRPFVISKNANIKVQYLSDFDAPAAVHIDGTERLPLNAEGVVAIKRSEKTFDWVNLFRREYFATLRSKLNWSGKLTR